MAVAFLNGKWVPIGSTTTPLQSRTEEAERRNVRGRSGRGHFPAGISHVNLYKVFSSSNVWWVSLLADLSSSGGQGGMPRHRDVDLTVNSSALLWLFCHTSAGETEEKHWWIHRKREALNEFLKIREHHSWPVGTLHPPPPTSLKEKPFCDHWSRLSQALSVLYVSTELFTRLNA